MIACRLGALARVVCVLLSLLPSALAGAATSDAELQRARDSFEYGDYERAREIAEELLRKNILSSDEQLIDANRIVALAYLYGESPGRREQAERYFLQLLSIEPEYRLDPFFTPPAAVEFFDEVRRDNEERLAPIREQRRVAKEARRAEELARQRFLDEQARTAASRVLEPTTELVERRHLALVFLPFGAGQFQNGDVGTGTFLASVQLLAGATSVVSFLALHELTSSGKVQREDLQKAHTLDALKWSSAAVFYLAWGYGAAQAWSRFEPEVRLGPTAITPRATAGADGATLGLSLEF